MNSLSSINACVIIPTYNNEKTLARVIDGVLEFGNNKNVIVVNDGSVDSTESILETYKNKVIVLGYKANVGKGNALKLGFKKAIELGFESAITIDSDGQHFPDDIPVFLKASKENPGCLLMGSRDMTHETIPGKSSFGNKFSNFWFKLETGIELPDTQTGYRLYPLAPLKKLKLFTSKFEMEIEVIVKLAWKDVKILPVNVKVIYDYDERVSHFRPLNDFTRISILNTYFVILTFAYYLPKRLIKASFKKAFWVQLKKDIVKPEESNLRKASSIAFGFFMGIIPLWGFQLLIGIPLAFFFRLNQALFIGSANISIPPMIPFIVWLSYYIGGFYYTNTPPLPELSEITLADIHVNFMQYSVGAVVLAIGSAVVSFVLSFSLLSLFRKS